MFEFVTPQPVYKRLARGAFGLLTPFVFVVFLLRGREAVLFFSTDPFFISNYSPSGLPTFLAEILSYGNYQATAAALLLALVSAAVLRRKRRVRSSSGAALVWYLPAFVAGVEAMRHARLLGSRHGFTENPTFSQIRADWITAAVASVTLVVVCVGLGFLLSRLARDSSRIPVATLALVLSVAGGWLAFLRLLWPRA